MYMYICFIIQEELRVVRDISEAVRILEKCQQTIIQRNEELRDLKVYFLTALHTCMCSAS